MEEFPSQQSAYCPTCQEWTTWNCIIPKKEYRCSQCPTRRKFTFSCTSESLEEILGEIPKTEEHSFTYKPSRWEILDI